MYTWSYSLHLNRNTSNSIFSNLLTSGSCWIKQCKIDTSTASNRTIVNDSLRITFLMYSQIYWLFKYSTADVLDLSVQINPVQVSQETQYRHFADDSHLLFIRQYKRKQWNIDSGAQKSTIWRCEIIWNSATQTLWSGWGLTSVTAVIGVESGC